VSRDDGQVAAAKLKLEHAADELDALARAYNPASAEVGVWREQALEATLDFDAAKAELRELTSMISRDPVGWPSDEQVAAAEFKLGRAVAARADWLELVQLQRSRRGRLGPVERALYERNVEALAILEVRYAEAQVAVDAAAAELRVLTSA